jgi:hypothetical protein
MRKLITDRLEPGIAIDLIDREIELRKEIDEVRASLAGPVSEPYGKLESWIEDRLSSMTQDVDAFQPRLKAYLNARRSENKMRADEAERQDIEARFNAQRLNTWLQQRAARSGEDTAAVQPIQPIALEKDMRELLKQIAEERLEMERELGEQYGSGLRRLRRIRLTRRWIPRVLHLFVFLLILAIGADLAFGLIPTLWAQIAAVTGLWFLQELFIEPAVQRRLRAWYEERLRCEMEEVFRQMLQHLYFTAEMEAMLKRS